jgi:hypothetical protein
VLFGLLFATPAPYIAPEQGGIMTKAWGFSVGIAVGVAIGIAIHNLTMGIALGVAIGVAFAVGRNRASREDAERP